MSSKSPAFVTFQTFCFATFFAACVVYIAKISSKSLFKKSVNLESSISLNFLPAKIKYCPEVSAKSSWFCFLASISVTPILADAKSGY